MTIQDRLARGFRPALMTAVAATIAVFGALDARLARATDIEVYFTRQGENTAAPNVLFILDTSQSMYNVETSAPEKSYDPLENYDGSCDRDAYYWSSVGGSTPDCSVAAKISATNFQCPSWKAAVDDGGFVTGLPGSSPPNRVAQYSGSKWTEIGNFDRLTICQNDIPYPILPKAISWNSIKSGSYTFYDGNYVNYLNSSGGGGKYRIDVLREVIGKLVHNTNGVKMGLMRYGYDGSQVFRQNTPTVCEVDPNPDESTRSGNGAPVVFPITNLDGSPVPGFNGVTVREQLYYQLGVDADLLNQGWIIDPSVPAADQPFQVAVGGGSTCPIGLFNPGGRSPIGGAMFESYLYYSGQPWSLKYGKQADLGSTFSYPSVWQSRASAACTSEGCATETYRSPIVDGCSKNYIILLSDGTTEQDNDIDGPVRQLPNFQQVTGLRDCDNDPYLDALGTPPPSQCVDDMAEYLFESDMRPGIAGIQNVVTYTVGFKLAGDNDPVGYSARNLLRETAQRGGGQFYEAQDAQSLEEILTEVLRQVLNENASFTSPAVAVNAFNRTQNLNELYMSLFRPALKYRWYGNVKKYRIEQDGDIIDDLGNPAVNPATGFFRDTARSIWSSGIDGADITMGGAAEHIDYSGRNVYSNLTGISNVTLTGSSNFLSAVKSFPDADARAKLGLGPLDSISASDLVDWAYGKDVGDVDGDTIENESRQDMGDPLHGKPGVVIYGVNGSTDAERLNDAAVFVTTNDGFLHAFDPVSGDELWSFIPDNLLSRMRKLYYSTVTAAATKPEDREYGLDGTLRIIRVDNNRNGIIETADEDGKRDRVYLVVGQRRGGSWYYSLDVSTKTAPKLMWAIDLSSYGGGQSWSTPQPARVKIGPADTTGTEVLFIGGGYSTAQDGLPYATDSVGNRLFMVNARTGTVLWRAGPSTDTGANLKFPNAAAQNIPMNNAFAADLRVVDLTGDSFADRVYAADVGGRIWRFDIFNGKNVVGSEGDRLVEGGVLADLGNASDLIKNPANTIRFFNPPDAALATLSGKTFVNLAIGSGHRELPVTDIATQNWFYSVRDYNLFQPLLSSQYQNSCPSPATGPCQQTITEGDLADLSNIVGTDAQAAVPLGSPGWRFELPITGEKSLGESLTFQGDIFFTTYAPSQTGTTEDNCAVLFGVNRVYVVSVLDARPTNNLDREAGESTDDRSRGLAVTGTIAPPPIIVFPPPDNPTTCVGRECRPSPIAYCGLELCGAGFNNQPVRTFWRQRGIN